MNDILGTGLILLIIGLAVAPFFLLSSQFGAPKRGRKDKDRNDGPITPVPTDAGGPFSSIRDKPDRDLDGDDSDGDGNDGGDGGGDGGGGD